MLSPKPTMMPDLVSTSGSSLLALLKVAAAHSKRSCGWTCFDKRGTVPHVVITACLGCRAFPAWATRFGSSQSIEEGLPRLISQKPQVRVQISPNIRKVAVPAPQHSPKFGHMASSHTV